MNNNKINNKKCLPKVLKRRSFRRFKHRSNSSHLYPRTTRNLLVRTTLITFTVIDIHLDWCGPAIVMANNYRAIWYNHEEADKRLEFYTVSIITLLYFIVWEHDHAIWILKQIHGHLQTTLHHFLGGRIEGKHRWSRLHKDRDMCQQLHSKLRRVSIASRGEYNSSKCFKLFTENIYISLFLRPNVI